jgi:hypothetical protein
VERSIPVNLWLLSNVSWLMCCYMGIIQMLFEWKGVLQCCLRLQCVNNLQDWERDWQMHFNPDKCEVIRKTTKRKIIPSSYFIHGKELNITSKGKYLGITISQNLSWNNHIDKVCRKANNTTAFLRRNLSSCPANIRTKCYTSRLEEMLCLRWF